MNFTFSITEAESWAEASNGVVKKSQAERSTSNQLRSDIDNAINAVGHEMWKAWGDTNNALAKRALEMLEAKENIQIHLHKVTKDHYYYLLYSHIIQVYYSVLQLRFRLQLQQEIFEIEKNSQLIQKAIADKSSALKVAHTRLESRTHRPEAELCNDYAQLGYNITKHVSTSLII